jgi:hypothetical protein
MASGFHLPDSFKSEEAEVRNPCAVILSPEKPIRRNAAVTVFSEIGRARDLTDGNTYFPLPVRP